MKVYITSSKIHSTIEFTEIKYSEIEDLIEFIKRTGGFYCGDFILRYKTHTLELDETHSYLNIHVEEEEDES